MWWSLPLLLAPAHAGPWVRDPGGHYVKVGGSAFVASVYDDPDVAEASDLAYTGQLATLYAEVGLPAGLQAVVQTAYAWGRNTDPATGWVYNSRGPAELALGLVWDVPWLDAPASLALTTRVPLHDGGAVPTLHPALGEPQVDLEGVAAAGQAVPVGPHWLWFAQEAGFRWRTPVIPTGRSEPSRANALTYRLQAGLAPSAGARSLGWLQIGVDGVWSPSADPLANTHHAWTAGLAGTLWRGLNLEASVQHIYWAQNASTGWGMAAGVSWRGAPQD